MHQKSSKPNRLTLYIGIALILGIVVGFIINKSYVGTENSRIATAEARHHLLVKSMKGFETPADPVLFEKIAVQIKDASNKKRMRNMLYSMIQPVPKPCRPCFSGQIR